MGEGRLPARVQAEGEGRGEREGRILAEGVIHRGLAGLDGAGLHGVKRLEAGDDVARRRNVDAEASPGQRPHPAGEGLGATKHEIERFWETRRHAPGDFSGRIAVVRSGRFRRGARHVASCSPASGQSGDGGDESAAPKVTPHADLRCCSFRDARARSPAAKARQHFNRR